MLGHELIYQYEWAARGVQTSSVMDQDKDRFEEQTLNGEGGYFDKVERVFISRRAFEHMIEAISPPPNSEYRYGNRPDPREV